VSEQRQPSANGDVRAQVNTALGGSGMVRVKFLKNTVHPDYGEVRKGDVLEVSQAYLQHYEAVGLAKAD
jgi:hypothetical protein